MTGLSNADRDSLRESVLGSIDDYGWSDADLIAAVEAIVQRAVTEALTEAADDEHCATCHCDTTECQDEPWCKRTWRHRGAHSVIRDEASRPN